MTTYRTPAEPAGTGPTETFEVAWERFYPRLVRLARQRLANQPRRDADEEDVALSAMRSFYRGLVAGDFPDLWHPDSLGKILVTITIRKANRRIRAQRAEKRGAGKVRGESAFAWDAAAPARVNGLAQAAVTSAAESDAAQLLVECRELLQRLEEPPLIQIACWKLEGWTHEEIAERLQCTVRTVERKLHRIRLKWTREHQADR